MQERRGASTERVRIIKVNTVKNDHRGQYKIETIRCALVGMIQGKSARCMQEFHKIPRSNLMRWYQQLTGKKANTRHPLNADEKKRFIEKAMQFELQQAHGRRYFTRDEEELFVTLVEEAHNAAFPYDREALKHLATTSGKEIYGKDFEVGDTWLKTFERRWKHRLSKVKCSSIDRTRGRKATAEVRDAVYKAFVKFLEDLQENGSFTAEQVENLGDHMCNADEIGGDERGQSRKKVYKGKKRTTNLWRTIDLGGDHNPFHVTLMLVSFANGTLMDSVMMIHSSPGAINPRMVKRLYRTNIMYPRPGV